MNKLKVLTVVGTRPEIIRLSRVLIALDKTESIDHILVHTGQNFDYELNQLFFDDLGIRKPDYFLESAGENTAQTIAKVIEKSDEVMHKEMPDAMGVRQPLQFVQHVEDHANRVHDAARCHPCKPGFCQRGAQAGEIQRAGPAHAEVYQQLAHLDRSPGQEHFR